MKNGYKATSLADSLADYYKDESNWGHTNYKFDSPELIISNSTSVLKVKIGAMII